MKRVRIYFDEDYSRVFPLDTVAERRFPLSRWLSLRTGDLVAYRRSGRVARVREAERGFVRMASGGFYSSSDRAVFMPVERYVQLRDITYL